MGNCVFAGASGGGASVVAETVKVVTSNGGVMELYAPISAACITDEFPGHGLFPSPKPLSPPLLHGYHLRPGQCYYLLPLHDAGESDDNAAFDDHCRATPYRMSAAESNNSQILRRAAESNTAGEKVLRCSAGNPTATAAGEVWKVRLVISPYQLSEILSHEARTQALIENVRAVAKCSSAVVTPHTAENSSGNHQNGDN